MLDTLSTTLNKKRQEQLVTLVFVIKKIAATKRFAPFGCKNDAIRNKKDVLQCNWDYCTKSGRKMFDQWWIVLQYKTEIAVILFIKQQIGLEQDTRDEIDFSSQICAWIGLYKNFHDRIIKGLIELIFESDTRAASKFFWWGYHWFKLQYVVVVWGSLWGTHEFNSETSSVHI